MFILKSRITAVLAVAALVVVALVVLAGCTEADTGTTATTSATETTGTTEGGTETTGTTEGGTETTGTTEGGTATTGTTEGGSESVQPVSEAFKICTDCHSDFNQFLADSEVLTKNFGHALHLNKGFRCEDCHAVPTHKPDEIVKPSMLACFECHGQEADAAAPGACSACHPPDFPLVPASHSAPGWLPAANPGTVKTVSAKHPEAALEDRAYCEMCHAASFCDSCHQTPMPHEADWQTAHPQTVNSKGKAVCETCHPDEYICNDCHHTGFKPGTAWREQHPPIVKTSGAQDCFSCHDPLVCARCHITGEFDPNAGPTG